MAVAGGRWSGWREWSQALIARRPLRGKQERGKRGEREGAEQPLGEFWFPLDAWWTQTPGVFTGGEEFD